MIRAALFDLGGVLFKLDIEGMCDRWRDRLGMTAQQILNAMYGGNDDQALTGAMPEDEWWDIVAGRLRISAEECRAFQKDFAFYEQMDADLAAFVASLRGRVRTAFVSNAWSNTRSYLEERGALELVDELICSAEVGVAKPDPRIFEIACERLEVEAHEAVLVDDMETHVEAARALGLHGILYRSTEQVVADVTALVGPA